MKRAAAIITDKGGRTAHAAIVSRELGIPCVVGAGNATGTLISDQMVTVNGSSGTVYEGRVEGLVSQQQELAALPSTQTKVYVNLGMPDLADRVAKAPSDGVGLLRAEFMVADIGEHPRHMMKEGRSQEFVEK